MHHMVLGILMAAASALSADDAGLNAERDDSSLVDVIVQFRHPPTEGHHNRVLARGGQLRHRLDIVSAAHYSIPAGQLYALRGDPEIVHISPNHALYATATLPSKPDYGWLTVAGATSAATKLPYDGTGIGVAVIDSGITDNVTDLNDTAGKTRIVYQESLIPGVISYSDDYGHGTMVAGLVGGNGNNSTCSTCTYTVRGIAPNVNIINLRVLDMNGSATDSTVIAAIQRAIQLKNQYNIRVINLSLGRPVFESYAVDPLCQAVQKAWAAGIVVVVAAGNNGRNNTYGNEGYATINAPGNSPYVITVGAMNTLGTLSPYDDKITSYSSKGPTLIDHVVKPDLVAPGNRMYSVQANKSTLVNTYSNNRVAWSSYDSHKTGSPSPAYFELSGTSMAAPLVSGTAALMIQRDPTLTPDHVKARLMLTATKLPQLTTTSVDPATGIQYVSENDIFTIGAGYLNVPAALGNMDTATLPATSPTASFDASKNIVKVITGTGAVWGSNVAWGTGAVWGTGAIWGTNVVWGTGAVWGTNIAWGTGAVWGTAAIWGTGAVWGTGNVQGDALTVAINGDN